MADNDEKKDGGAPEEKSSAKNAKPEPTPEKKEPEAKKEDSSGDDGEKTGATPEKKPDEQSDAKKSPESPSDGDKPKAEKKEKKEKKSVVAKVPPLSAWEEDAPRPLPSRPANGTPDPVRELPPVLNWFGKSASVFAQNIFGSVVAFAIAAFIYIGVNYIGFRLAYLIGDPNHGIGKAVNWMLARISLYGTAELVKLNTLYLITIFIAKILVPAITAGVLGAALLGMYGRLASGKKTNFPAMVIKSIGMIPQLAVAYLIVYGYLWVTFKIIAPKISGTSLNTVPTSALGLVVFVILLLTVVIVGGIAIIAMLTRLFSVFTFRKTDVSDKEESFGGRYAGLFSEFRKMFNALMDLKTWWRFKWVIYFFAWFAIVPLLGWFIMNLYRDKATLGSSMQNAVRRVRVGLIPSIFIGIIVTALALLGNRMFDAHMAAVTGTRAAKGLPAVIAGGNPAGAPVPGQIDSWNKPPHNAMTFDEKKNVEQNGKTIKVFSFVRLEKKGDAFKEIDGPKLKVKGVALLTLKDSVKAGDAKKDVDIYYVTLPAYDKERDLEDRQNMVKIGEVGKDVKFVSKKAESSTVKVNHVLLGGLLLSLLGLALIFPLAGIFLGMSYNEMNYAIDENETGNPLSLVLVGLVVLIGIIFGLL